MKGEIKTITKITTKDGKPGYCIQIKLEDGKIALTYLVKTYRNFKRWKPFLEEGIKLQGLRIKEVKENGEIIIDADSDVCLTPEEQQRKTLERLAKLEVF